MSLQPPSPVVTARGSFVLEKFAQQITSALATVPGGVVQIGWPDPEDVRTNVVGKKFLVAIYPQMSRRVPNRAAINRIRTQYPVIPLSVARDPTSGAFVFAGSVVAGLNVAVSFRAAPWAVVYTTISADTLETIPAALAAMITSAAISASASGASLNVSGPISSVVIGGTGAQIREVDRIERRVLVSVWAAPPPPAQTTPTVRDLVTDAIMENVGTTFSQMFDLTDGSSARVRLFSQTSIDQSQSDVSLLESRIIYLLEYGVLQSTPAAQVVAMVPTLTA
jgi:hypothetical protein